ncbi:hypothetical protein LLEC1_08047 [Akanthomyces lecanii]|uniref:Transcription factor domain-containing protein n=1 Tax=Cordyceps confragosa TaxID=2714763 RepID=A0A179I828_CORDF|nr:hypothetical protein LLEC1_08047 [Akanthomyces lecanii]
MAPSPLLDASASASRETLSSMVDRVVADLGLSSVEASLLRTSVLSSEFVEQFIIGPSFGRVHQEYLAKKLYSAPATLGHAFTASAMSWGHDCNLISAEPRSSDARVEYFDKMYHHATEAVATLRSMQPADSHEMCLCLALGAIIMTFTLKVQVADARAICRQTLELAKPIYTREDMLDGTLPEDLPFMSCLVLTDTAESLLFCEPPTLCYRTVPGQHYVDRYVGISHNFLPLLHDVADLSFRLKMESGKPGGHSAALARFAHVHSALEQDIRRWAPDGHGGFAAGRFTATEVAHMLCQAEAVRNAARLVLHRLKHCFGSQDEVAEAISSHILTSLKTTTLGTRSTPRCIDFPLIAACLELESKSERMENFSSLSPISSYSSPFHARTGVILDAAWEARRNGQSLYWYDLAAFIPESSMRT